MMIIDLIFSVFGEKCCLAETCLGWVGKAACSCSATAIQTSYRTWIAAAELKK